MKGNGRIYKRGSIYWIDYWAHGKRIRESARTDKARVARELLKTRIATAWSPEVNRRVTVGEILDCLLDHYRVNGYRSLRETTAHIAPLKNSWENLPAWQLTTKMVQEYVQARFSQGRSPATINRELAALRRACTLSINSGSLTTAPYIPTLREHNTRRGFFTHEEILTVFAAVSNDDTRDFIEWSYWTGMRRGETRSLTWGMVDDGTIFLDGKTGQRRLVLAGPLAEILERRRAKQIAGAPWIFHRDGKPIGDFRKEWKNACELAGCPDRIFHDLRRTGVRNLLRAGVSRHVAMAISGHRTEAVFRRYDIVDETDQRNALQQLVEHNNS